jgi:hypothetical protein
MLSFTDSNIEVENSLPDAMKAHLTPRLCRTLSGAPDGSVVHVVLEGGIVVMDVEHPEVVEMRRQMFFLPSGGMNLHNQRVRLAPSARGSRHLAQSVTRQVSGVDALSAYSQLRVERLTSAVLRREGSGVDTQSDDPDVGYWLLPQLGFDAPFPDRSALAAAFPGISVASLREVLADKERCAWWREVGHTYSFGLRFDLEHGSWSRTALDDYTNHRNR